jgi:NAD(P)-dependent dehydrogenase (short-subunit alcohol dehydrogenase family)
MNSFAKIKESPWTLDWMPRINNKTFIITGADSGIGFAAARVFAHAGAYVVLACRNAAKSEEAIKRIYSEKPNEAVEFMELDLASLDSVRAFAKEAPKRLGRIDVLCNSAGVFGAPYKHYTQTKDGFELHFGINYLSRFALTGLLFEKITASTPARIIMVSSWGQRPGGIMFENLQGTRNYNSMYGNCQLANLLFTYELDRRLRARNLDVKSIACHPGFAPSNPLATGTAMAQSQPTRFIKFLVSTAQLAAEGALSEIYASVGEDINGGDYVGPSDYTESNGLPKKMKSSAFSYDAGVARQLWTVSEELTGVHFLS